MATLLTNLDESIYNMVAAAVLADVGTVAFSIYEASKSYTDDVFARVKSQCWNCPTKTAKGFAGAYICSALGGGVDLGESILSVATKPLGGDLGKSVSEFGAAVVALANPVPPLVAALGSVASSFFFPGDKTFNVLLPAAAGVALYVYDWKAMQSCQ